MKKILTTIITVLGFYTGFSQNDSTLPIAITIKPDKEYYMTYKKEAYATVVKENGYVINSDSVRQKYFDITLEIKNTSIKPIGIWLMTCSWEDNFLVNNNYIFIRGHDCDKNIPAYVKFNPGESKVYKTTLIKSIKFDYPCQYCVYGRQVETTKLGLIIIDDIFKNKLGMFDYNLGMEDKSKWNIIWSNSLSLLGKQPESKVIPIIKN